MGPVHTFNLGPGINYSHHVVYGVHCVSPGTCRSVPRNTNGCLAIRCQLPIPFDALSESHSKTHFTVRWDLVEPMEAVCADVKWLRAVTSCGHRNSRLHGHTDGLIYVKHTENDASHFKGR
jgi:hypothetical protein